MSASEGQFSQVSFVNGICTLRGGTHVNMIADQLAACVPLDARDPCRLPFSSQGSTLGFDAESLTALLRFLPLPPQQVAGADQQEEQERRRQAVPDQESTHGVRQRPHREPCFRLSGARPVPNPNAVPTPHHRRVQPPHSPPHEASPRRPLARTVATCKLQFRVFWVGGKENEREVCPLALRPTHDAQGDGFGGVRRPRRLLRPVPRRSAPKRSCRTSSSKKCSSPTSPSPSCHSPRSSSPRSSRRTTAPSARASPYAPRRPSPSPPTLCKLSVGIIQTDASA